MMKIIASIVAGCAFAVVSTSAGLAGSPDNPGGLGQTVNSAKNHGGEPPAIRTAGDKRSRKTTRPVSILWANNCSLPKKAREPHQILTTTTMAVATTDAFHWRERPPLRLGQRAAGVRSLLGGRCGALMSDPFLLEDRLPVAIVFLLDVLIVGKAGEGHRPAVSAFSFACRATEEAHSAMTQ